MNTNTHTSFTNNLARFLRDLLKMGDLQMQLLSVDLGRMGRGAKSGVFLVVFALALLLGSLPVLMFGIAGVVHLISRIRIEYAWLLVGICTTLGGLGLLLLAIRQLNQSATALQQSQQEFRRNIEWMRGVLHRE